MQEVLDLPVLRGAGAEVLAGREALDRSVQWVHPAELSEIGHLLRGGELVLTTGIALPEEPGLLAHYAASLHTAGAVGLVLELGRRWRTAPAALVDACADLGLPLVSVEHEVSFAAVAQVIGERIVDARVGELRAVEHVHQVFTELTLHGADTGQVLAAVQRLSGRSVVLEDERHRVLDYVLDATLAPGGAEWMQPWDRRSRRVDVPGRTGWDAAQEALVTRVGRPGHVTGRLLLHLGEPPTSRLVALLERAAATIALHREHARDRDTVARRTQLALVLGLLADPTAPDLHRRCELAGLPTARRTYVGVSVRAMATRDVLPDVLPDALPDVLPDVLSAVLAAGHQLQVPLLAAEVDRDVRVVLAMGRGADAAAVTAALLGRVGRSVAVRMTAGRGVSDLGHVDRSLIEAQQVLESLTGTAVLDDVVHRVEDAHVRGLIALLRGDPRLGEFARRELSALQEHDRATSRPLLGAVSALLRHPASKSEAAASVHLSRPAFYKRLARAEELLGVDLDDPETRLSLHLALLVEELAGELGA